MKTRQEIKAIGKEQFKANYWNCVLTALLVSAVIGALAWMCNSGRTEEIMKIMEGTVSVTKREVSPGNSAGSLLMFLLSGPLAIGLNCFFIRNVQGLRDNLTVTTPFTEAFNNYPRKLGGALLERLFIVLWSLLLLIPGIIKAISYSMTKYILADCPNVKPTDALKLSMRMMDGHKWEAFMLGLSFLGWAILTVLTLGILGVFYVIPYMQSTYAQYWLEIRDEALRTGAVTIEQLEGEAL